MKFSEFSEFLEKIENLASRNEVTEIISKQLNSFSIEEVKESIYLLQGMLYPKYVDSVFNISRKLIFRALETLTNDPVLVKSLYSQYGDLGLVAEEIIAKKKFDPNSKLEVEKDLFSDKVEKVNLTVNSSILEVYNELVKLSILEGKGSQEGKIRKYQDIIVLLDPKSVRYFTRMILGELRLGVSEKTILDSLSWFKAGDKSLRKKLDYAFGVKADLGELTKVVIESKDIEKDLETIKIEPRIPIASKLVERESSPETVWERMPNCWVQPKLDGLRGQIHYKRLKVEDEREKVVGTKNFWSLPLGEVAIFSRNMENMTEQFPEIVNDIKSLGVDSIILDSEIIGFNSIDGKYMTYQETMQRKRKYDIDKFSSDIPVKAMCFDILYLNGEDLTSVPVEKRMELLRSSLAKAQETSSLRILETIQMKNLETLDQYFHEKVNGGLEGIIAKEAESTYDPGTRNFKWIKLKANSKSELVDTLDVVVLGYYSGRGQRAKFGLGALLTGVYDPAKDIYYSVGKVGTGMKESDLEKIMKDLEKYRIDSKPENVIVDKSLFPDVWVTPKIVMEIDADEITRSPNHTAARGVVTNVKKEDPSKGLSIRFPRMKVWNRDKDYPNTVDELVRIYELRKGK
jgi:DNA ligase-1